MIEEIKKRSQKRDYKKIKQISQEHYKKLDQEQNSQKNS